MSGSAASVDTLSRPDSRAKAADVGDRRQTIDGIAPGKDLCRESAVFADPYRHVLEGGGREPPIRFTFRIYSKINLPHQWHCIAYALWLWLGYAYAIGCTSSPKWRIIYSVSSLVALVFNSL